MKNDDDDDVLDSTEESFEDGFATLYPNADTQEERNEIMDNRFSRMMDN